MSLLEAVLMFMVLAATGAMWRSVVCTVPQGYVDVPVMWKSMIHDATGGYGQGSFFFNGIDVMLENEGLRDIGDFCDNPPAPALPHIKKRQQSRGTPQAGVH